MRFNGVTEVLHSFADQMPRFYLVCISLFSAVILLAVYTPMLIAAVLLISLLSNPQEALDLSNWLSTLVQLVLIISGIYISIELFKLDLSRPKGAQLDKDKAPKLINLINELKTHFNVNKIDHIIATENFELTVKHTPKFYTPFISHTTLVIGLPVIQSTSPNQLKALLARRIGQLSMAQNKATSFTMKLYSFLLIYANHLGQAESHLHKVFYWFFKVLSDIYFAFAFYTFRQDELTADSYALEIVNDKELAETICQSIVANHFLKNRYWPHIYKISRQSPESPLQPHANLAEAIATYITPEVSETILNDYYNRVAEYQSFTPPLRNRLHNIGHDSYTLPDPITVTAANYYLGDTLTPLCNLFDKVWQSKNQKHHQTLSSDDAQQKRLDNLASKIKSKSLSATEAWEYASLTEKLKGYQAAIPIYKKILEKNPRHAKAMFAVGRILLSYNDERGQYVLEQAIELEPSMKRTAGELIDRFKSRQSAGSATPHQATPA